MSSRPPLPTPKFGIPYGNTPFPFPDLGLNGSGWSQRLQQGAGTYGAVVHWVKTDENGNFVDELAVKTCPWHKNDDFHGAAAPGMNKEAGLQAQLNRHGCENIVHLRGYKFDRASNCAKLYLEFAPNGNLGHLRRNYRAFQQYLPEAFLWFVFHGFAKAACAMATKGDGVWRNLATGRVYRPSLSMVHFDIKLDNIVVGHEATIPSEMGVDDIPLRYPTVKLADFGLAEITGADTVTNPKGLFWKTTCYFSPPETLHYGCQWGNPPNGKPRSGWNQEPISFEEAAQLELDDDFPGFYFGPRHNVWTFAKVMYDLLTLSEPSEFYKAANLKRSAIDDTIYAPNFSEQEYYEGGQHMIPEIRTMRNPEYSARLRHLIRDCLRPNIDQRPTPELLLDLTNRGLRIALGELRPGAGQAPVGERVYFKGNEINRMTPGNTEFWKRGWMWEDLQKNRYPDETPLNPPRAWNAYRRRQEEERQRQLQQLQYENARLNDDRETQLQQLQYENARLNAQISGVRRGW